MSLQERNLQYKELMSRSSGMTIGQRIKQLREERGITLTELAERANIAKSYLSNIEREVQSNPSMLFLHKICSVFAMDVESFLPKARPAGGLDPEWQALLREAVDSGLDKEELRAFIEYQKFKNRTIHS